MTIREIKVFYGSKVVGEGEFVRKSDIKLELYGIDNEIDDGWVVTWHHQNGKRGVEILPDPIPESALQSWKKGGLTFKFNIGQDVEDAEESDKDTEAVSE
jgi:hypothetical protein